MSKRMEEAKKKIDSNKIYEIDEAVKLALLLSSVKFDETVELHLKLGVDSKQADQQVRGVMVLPNGTGKSKKVLVLTNDAKAKEAEDAGADYVGADDMIQKIQSQNWFDFDVIVATPDMMPKLGRVAKILGPKGLMPNPKTGTVTTDITKAIADIKAGKIEYRLDKSNIIHCPIGKVSFKDEKIIENLKALLAAVIKAKPVAAKGTYLKSISISTSMGPGIKINTNSKVL